MGVNPFSSITSSPFAYTGHNESLIHCCHLQPTVTLSRINSWSSRAEKEQRSAGAWTSLYLFHSKQQTVDPFMCWQDGCIIRLFRCTLRCVLFWLCFAFLWFYCRSLFPDLLFICVAGIFRLWTTDDFLFHSGEKGITLGANLFFFPF